MRHFLKLIKVRLFFVVGALALTQMSCVLFSGSGGASYDSKTVNVQTFNLFNQRDLSTVGSGNWRGDWFFRRQRLELIDKELRASKPDLLIYQETMDRLGSPSESDEAILSAGSLQGYQWRKTELKRFDDTDEVESMGVAAGLPLKMSEKTDFRKSWVLGNDGFMIVDVVDLEDQPIIVFNVQMPPKIGRKYLWYTFIQERVSDFVASGNYCSKRVVIAGYMPTEQGAQRFQSFKESLQLKDSSEEFCNVASECYTATPENGLYLAATESVLSGQVDKILVHKTALVYSSSRNMTSSKEFSESQQTYGLKRIWASKRFGWTSSIRLPRCQIFDQ
ncbi:hypothetical protein N9D31_01880 [Oligoflexaceae bacterium]|nr:hypothetical protein [Oligoflexaceae bacterium]